MTARYALYYAPRGDSPLGRFGAAWLGRCAETGTRLPQSPPATLPVATFAEFTAAPRRYGFHATLKAPFRLAPGVSSSVLVAALERFCAARRPIALPPLQACMLDDFLALVPAAASARVDDLAGACLTRFDCFRAVPDAAERARRRAEGLTAGEQAHLQRWGYPYVFDAFRFHLSLTGTLRDASVAARQSLLEYAAAGLDRTAEETPVVDAVCLFEEPAPGADLRLAHRARLTRPGRLVYVVGPSGVGKDSLLDWARARVPRGAGVRFARRTITRPPAATGERHLPASDARFDDMLARGEFALHWSANSARYGIGREIVGWLERGETVVVNGSRAHVAEARRSFPLLELVHVEAPEALLRVRLFARAREDPPAAAARLARNTALAQAVGPAALVLVNDGPIEVAGARLAAFVAGGS